MWAITCSQSASAWISLVGVYDLSSRARPHCLFTLDVDSNVPWHVQLFQLQLESHELMVAFRPVALVQAVPDVVACWSLVSGKPPRGARKLAIEPLAYVPAMAFVPALALADMPAARVEGAASDAAEDPIDDGASDSSSSHQSDVARGADGVGGALDDLDAAADVGWDISDVSSDEDVYGGHYVCVLFFL